VLYFKTIKTNKKN